MSASQDQKEIPAAQTAEERVLVVNELGLHARPAAKIAQVAQSFEAEVALRAGDAEVDAKSILDILTLSAAKGAEVQVTAAGQDAPKAVRAICALFESRFGESR